MKVKPGQRCLYDVLGVEPTASVDAIKRAYRALAKKLHPDLNRHDVTAEARFKEVSAAYDVLSDQVQRADYDRDRRRSAAGNRPSPGGAGPRPQRPFDDGPSFTQRMREAWRRQYERERQEQTYDEQPYYSRTFDDAGGTSENALDVKLTFKQAMLGLTKSLPLAGSGVCLSCGGAGVVESEPPARCPLCRRSGVRGISTAQGRIVQLCMSCGWQGNGEVACRSCRGTGRSSERAVKVKIPPGLYDGAILRHPGPGGRSIFLRIGVGASRTFQRDGDDLMTTVSVPAALALSGGAHKIPTLDGSVLVKIPPGLHDGQKMRLSGRGVRKRAGGSGDLYVTFAVKRGKSKK